MEALHDVLTALVVLFALAHMGESIDRITKKRWAQAVIVTAICVPAFMAIMALIFHDIHQRVDRSVVLWGSAAVFFTLLLVFSVMLYPGWQARIDGLERIGKAINRHKLVCFLTVFVLLVEADFTTIMFVYHHIVAAKCL